MLKNSSATKNMCSRRERVDSSTRSGMHHTTGNDDHRGIDEQTLTRRVDLIVATEATRQACK